MGARQGNVQTRHLKIFPPGDVMLMHLGDTHLLPFKKKNKKRKKKKAAAVKDLSYGLVGGLGWGVGVSQTVETIVEGAYEEKLESHH